MGGEMMEWKTVTAEEFCFRVTDGTHDSPKPKNEGRFLITSKHLLGSSIDFSKANKISEEDYQKIIVRSKVDQYDILFSMIGTIGNVYRETSPIVEYAVKNMAVFKFAGDNLKSLWLYYWFKSPAAQAYIHRMQAGSTQGYLTLSSLRAFPVAVPPLPEQKRIAAILSSLDDKIENNRKINKNLEEQAQALFKSWFVDFEPFKEGEFVDSELGLIPKGWKVGCLEDVAYITMGQSPSGSSYNDVGQGMVFYQGRTEFTDRFPTVRLYTTEPGRIAEPMSVLLSVRAPVGDLNIATEQCCIGRGLASLKAKDNLNSFLYYLLKSLSPQFDVYNGEGTVFGSINKVTLSSMPVVIPNIDSLLRFEKIIKELDEQYLNNEMQSRRLAQLRDTLLPKLMNGEIEI